MPEDLLIGRYIHGEATVGPLQDGMHIVFEKSLTPVFEGDMLIVEMPKGEMILHVIENLGDTISVNGLGPNSASWNFHIERVEGNAWAVRLDPQHKELLAFTGKRPSRG
ncbi:hypothetical protein NKH34_17120 [Mesorhizobium sp. M1148]|uniref:hypothetical protein n=1 Tax=unclassified Mesorhizobium TaxID=325217 RepID=UPI0003CEBC1C|nr:hypothetical protein [Mesorhizobium sp. LSJC264A00]ESX23895.1 hypothetical protein X767_13630 [Mesorhizobium sp. LSJC264A00]